MSAPCCEQSRSGADHYRPCNCMIKPAVLSCLYEVFGARRGTTNFIFPLNYRCHTDSGEERLPVHKDLQQLFGLLRRSLLYLRCPLVFFKLRDDVSREIPYPILISSSCFIQASGPDYTGFYPCRHPCETHRRP